MLQRLFKAAGLLTTELATVCGIFAVSALAGGLLVPVLPLYLSSLGASPAQVGFLFTAFAITFAIFEAVWGWLSERMAARTILSLRMLGAAGLVLLLTQAVSPWALYAIQLARGAIESAVWPVGRAIVATSVSRQRRGAAMGLITTAVWGSVSVGALVGGVLADYAGYKGVFPVSAVILLTGAALVITRVRKPAAPVPSVESQQPQATSPVTTRVVSRREIYSRFAILGAVAFAVFMGRSSQSAFVPLFSREVADSEATDIGFLFLAAGFASVVTLLPLGRFGTPEEVANVVVFLASERASLMAGACVNVDGCQSRSLI